MVLESGLNIRCSALLYGVNLTTMTTHAGRIFSCNCLRDRECHHYIGCHEDPIIPQSVRSFQVSGDEDGVFCLIMFWAAIYGSRTQSGQIYNKHTHLFHLHSPSSGQPSFRANRFLNNE